MLWKGRRQSSNIEDRRGMGGGGGMRFPGGLGGLGGGMGGRMGRRGGGIGIFGILILLGVCWLLGINPLALLSGGMDTGGSYPEQQSSLDSGAGFSDPASEEMKEFVSVVLADTEDTWNALLPEVGATYREPRLVLFSDGVDSACGYAQSAVGPFYCPGDEKVYLDLDFFDELSRRFGAPGDFAQAYVIAHEVGHHVQNVLGIEEQVRQARGSMSGAQANELSVRVELQADCFSGVWAHHAQRTRQILEQGDVEEALNAAAQIGDDTLQRKSQGTVVPESFTHGSSAQRVSWFKRGMQSGSVRDCNTFDAGRL